jgi:hypothetical protein
MKTKLLAAAVIAATIGGLHAAPVVIASPDKAQVMVFSQIINKDLHWNARTNALIASMTFSNVNYVSRTESRTDQDVYFTLSGVQYDPARRTFYKTGRHVPVAIMQEGVFGRQIKLAPGARILALDNHGRISVMLVANRSPVMGSQWVRVQEDSALQEMFANTGGIPPGQASSSLRR